MKPAGNTLPHAAPTVLPAGLPPVSSPTLRTEPARDLTTECAPRDTFYFLHIPKTAGLSLRRFLCNQWPERDIFLPNDPSMVRHDPARDLRPFKLFSGHFGHDFRGLIGRPHRALTLLRHPVARTISYYHHLRYQPEGYWLADLARHLTLNEFLADSRVRWAITDEQVQSLTHPYSHPGFRLLDPPGRLALAKSNLDQLDFCGLQEHLVESVLMMSRQFGFIADLERPVDQVNKGAYATGPDAIAPELRELIHSVNGLDLQLYAHAAGKFAAAVRAYLGPDAPAERPLPADESASLDEVTINLFRRKITAELQQRQAQLAARIQSDQFDYQFNAPLWGSGWYDREFDPTGFSPGFRWTKTGAPSSILLPLPPARALQLFFMVVSWNNQTPVLDSLEARLNGRKLLLQRVEKGPPDPVRGVLFSAKVPPESHAQPGLARLELSSCKQERGDSPDTRKLGVAISWIGIRPG